ncbi:HR1 repeat rho-binding protein [Venturia nashicola]|uniref:HR1 repeat rho-binding protein n=1 Tax=Venturia nashicola TaxID=86259 RepID=A0A4Z1NFJ4_9PEZI|nr:HR1 repeat rho-binding protein [Venturia nashicola]TLD20034.1 HR1 repeat rho-binding protein [Venturia nashicola]
MASIFTFQSDPIRVSSPWSTPRTTTPKPVEPDTPPNGSLSSLYDTNGSLELDRLEAEPQEGPIEYKLHLLLRPRRSFIATSTGLRISGSYRSIPPPPKLRSVSETPIPESPSLLAVQNQPRQHRLEQLTTQLLWRLQQSCPHHSASYHKQATPSFPDATKLGAPVKVGPPMPGLEESKGALYEIGVADDGTFVGLAKDEMDESISTLSAMAASLGCVVEVLRMVTVGDCEWMEPMPGEETDASRKEKLWVAEVYVKPNTGIDRFPKDSEELFKSNKSGQKQQDKAKNGDAVVGISTQLKISLTGTTASGKSSLLGSLTTATLDNGRGKSRLNLLRHRHEIASGMTSSVTQELLGYSDAAYVAGQDESVDVVNYASGNVSSWVDIHASCQSGRLVLLSDSAGHPRYRRTTVRGLVGWDPDWTLLCIPADNTEDTSGMTGSTPPPEEVLGVGSADVDLSQAHLDLCLKLNLPIVVVITKLDLASKAGLRNCLAQILSTLKAAGRKPVILPNMPNASGILTEIAPIVLASSKKALSNLDHNSLEIVPIVLTSAINGTGISTLHALLYQLPIPLFFGEKRNMHTLQPDPLFHIEDTYNARSSADLSDTQPVVSGHVRYGQLSIGDELLVGPYATDMENKDVDALSVSRPQIPTSRSFPGALGVATSLPLAALGQEWRKVKITSLRNLRLPVQTLYTGQVGTVGVQSLSSPVNTPSLVRLRKGMVLASGNPMAKKGFVAEFARSDVDGLSIGMGIVVYVASVRASAKVVAGTIPDDDCESLDEAEGGAVLEDDDGFGFSLDDVANIQQKSEVRADARLLVTFQFITSREYVEDGSQVLIMPGGGPGLYGHERGEKGVAGLGGFVGKVVRSY